VLRNVPIALLKYGGEKCNNLPNGSV
jgi:hypothetical protein